MQYSRARRAHSALQKERLAADCSVYLPEVLRGCPEIEEKKVAPQSKKDLGVIRTLFPLTCDVPAVEFAEGPEDNGNDSAARQPIKVGVVLSGGQAPGGHNVIAGVFDTVRRWHPESVLVGFLDGPHGIFTGNFVEVTEEIMDGFRNTGGFDMLGSGRHKIESPDQLRNSQMVCDAIGLDGLVVIGGDDSNTNAALLAEHFKAQGCRTKVIGVPKTIDGDLKCHPYIPTSFGFDTACKTYAMLVGNVSVDALSAQKYYHLVRLMGRSASNIALEVALQTRPNACLLGEEVARDKKTLRQLTTDLADMVEERSKQGKNYGVIVLPEGLIEFIPEFRELIKEINELLSKPTIDPTEVAVSRELSRKNLEIYQYLPHFIRTQLLLDRDPHGNVQVAKIETEKLLAATVLAELEKRRASGRYSGSFKTQFHAYGYEGRAALPTIFDASYCYALGATAASLALRGCTGLIASVTGLLEPAAQWRCGGIPITSLCTIERRSGNDKPVIQKALVNLEGPHSQPFQAFEGMRKALRTGDAYVVPGPVQFDITNCPAALDLPMILQLELGVPHRPLGNVPVPKQMEDFLFQPQAADSRSKLQQWRMARAHRVPEAITEMNLAAVQVSYGRATIRPEQDMKYMRKFFWTVDAPIVNIEPVEGRGHHVPSGQRIGVVFCGRQAPGCHDLLCGMVDMLAKAEDSKVLGFVGGTRGLFSKQVVELTPELCHAYAGTGGLELLGRTVDRIKSEAELQQAFDACEELGLTGLVLIGGARTNTDAAYVAEHFKRRSAQAAVVGVPCGIEGNMVNEFVEASIGFDSAAKAMAQLVGSTAIDGSSARKYYYFLRIMDGAMIGGKISSSHLALEVALQTMPNMLLLTEEVDEKRMSLRDLVNEIADVIAQRAADGKNFGTILVAEGLLAAIPEFRSLISELNALPMPSPRERVLPQLTQWSRALFQSLPEFIQDELLLERQSNNAVQLAQLETERLLAALVSSELKGRRLSHAFKGSFSPVCQFLGYQVRCSMPSDFDSDYAYTLGATSVVLAAGGYNGYMAVASDLAKPVKEWRVGGVPFTAMLAVQASNLSSTSQPRPTIFPRRIDLEGPAFKQWCEDREVCTTEEWYQNPGPIQLSGENASHVCSTISTRFSYIRELDTLRQHLHDISDVCRPGCDPRTLRVATQTLATLNTVLRELTGPLVTTAQHPGLCWWSSPS